MPTIEKEAVEYNFAYYSMIVSDEEHQGNLHAIDGGIGIKSKIGKTILPSTVLELIKNRILPLRKELQITRKPVIDRLFKLDISRNISKSEYARKTGNTMSASKQSSILDLDYKKIEEHLAASMSEEEQLALLEE